MIRTLALAGLLAAGPAVAAGSSPDDAASAEALFREARSLVVAGDYSDACPKFAESLRLDHAPGTLLSLADCEEHTRRIATAWGHFRELSRELSSTDERQPFAAQRATALAPRLPHLTIRSSVGLSAGAEIWRDDVQIARSSLDTPLPVDPGTHTVVVTEGERVLCRVEVEVREGQSGVLVAESSGHDVTRPTWNATKGAGWITGGFAIAALATGTIFGVSALSNSSASDAGCTRGVCSDAASAREYDDARSEARIADVALGIGLAATAVASYLLFVRPRKSDSPPVSHAPLASLGLGQVVW